MKIVEKLSDLRDAVQELKEEKRGLGFVPTMGALHEGHLSLVRQSIEECPATVVSIFVNPTQFNEANDFENYPNQLTEDLKLLEELNGVDLVFLPKPEDMYHAGASVSVDPGYLAQPLCGMTRQGHFRGVLTIVMKFFNLIQPDFAFFGAKDYQQFLLISKMVEDLNMNIQLRLGQTFREEDGLAMSSRNALLSPAQREEAPIIFQCLQMGIKMIKNGEDKAMEVIARLMNDIIENSLLEIDYLSIVDPTTLEDLIEVSPKNAYLIAVAAYMGPVRLIDNILHLPE
jgi:pantoate--beta-alanine ligase